MSSSEPEKFPSGGEGNLTLEEQVFQAIITIGLPLMITGIAFAVIAYAFAEWKLY